MLEPTLPGGGGTSGSAEAGPRGRDAARGPTDAQRAAWAREEAALTLPPFGPERADADPGGGTVVAEAFGTRLTPEECRARLAARLPRGDRLWVPERPVGWARRGEAAAGDGPSLWVEGAASVGGFKLWPHRSWAPSSPVAEVTGVFTATPGGTRVDVTVAPDRGVFTWFAALFLLWCVLLLWAPGAGGQRPDAASLAVLLGVPALAGGLVLTVHAAQAPGTAAPLSRFLRATLEAAEGPPPGPE